MRVQAAKAEEDALRKAANLDGKDAFEALKNGDFGPQLTSAGSNGSSLPPQLAKPLEDARADLERLMVDAAEGFPVAGRPDTWASERPAVQPVGSAAKPRGFLDYNRYGQLYFCMLCIFTAYKSAA